MFQLVCDPSGAVVETTLKQLVPAVVKWGNQLEHVLMVLLSHVLSSVQVCKFLTLFFSLFLCLLSINSLYYHIAALPTPIRC